MALEEHGGVLEGKKLSEEERFDDRHRRKSSKELYDEVAGEGEPAPKRVKSEDDGAARDRRRDSRHRSSPERRSREKERHGRGSEHRDDERSRKDGRRDKDRNRENERNKERDRDRNKERNRERERDREKDRLRDRERIKDKDREGYRYRERERERDREKIRERDREREHERSRHSRNLSEKRDKHREKSNDRDVYKRDKKSIEREQDSWDPQRNQRTVFAYQLSLKAGERDLYEFFSKAGKVRDVHLMMDHSSRCSKGVGCIEFYDIMSVPMAMALSGQLLLGQPVLVKPSEGQKNLVQSNASIPDEANGLIEPYPEIAEEQTLQISTVSKQEGMQKSGTNVHDFNDVERGGAVNTIHGSNNQLDANPEALATGVSVSLAHNSPALNVTSSGVLVLSTIGVPSECLLLKNVFDPSTEAEPDFELDIKDEIEDECSRFGPVKHMFVDKNSAGFVYLRFDSVASAINAQRALHGRWFAGKMVTASFMLPQTYSTKFPSA